VRAKYPTKPVVLDDLFQVIEDIRIKKLQNLLVSA